MLTAIASLAGSDSSSLGNLVDRASAVDCLCLIFQKFGDCKFLRCELSSNNGEEEYLYHKEPSGKPGLFLSWTIPSQGQGSIKRFQGLVKLDTRTKEEERELKDFWDKKFAWFSKIENGKVTTKNKLLNDVALLDILDQDPKSLLSGVCKSYATSFDQIKNETQRVLSEYEFTKEKGVRNNKLLVTLAFENESGVTEYPKQILPFVRLFSRAVSGEVSATNSSVCTVCNSQLAGALSPPYPVEFLTQDQLVYVPDGSTEKKGFALAVCQRCSDALRAGQSLINAHLSYKMLKSQLSFWLIPILPNTNEIIEYVKSLKGNGRPIYLNGIREMCQGLDSITDVSYGAENISESESWLTYLSIFYYKDSQGHIRIEGVAEGIYPSRLRELINCSRTVQGLYPYFLNNPKIMFSFPLLSRFFEEEKSESTLVSIMESLFTESQIDQSFTFSKIAEKVRSEGLTRTIRKSSMSIGRLMKSFAVSALEALIIIEYLLETGVITIEGGKRTSLSNPFDNDKPTDALRHFTNSHKLVNQSPTIRSIFLVGVAVGILLEVQMKEFKSYPFWKHLNRLELDIERVMRFYPDVKNRLMQYRTGVDKEHIENLRALIEYIGANLDFDDSEANRIQRDLIDLVFSIGLSEGYLIYHGIGV